jgi:hypothetical protein
MQLTKPFLHISNIYIFIYIYTGICIYIHKSRDSAVGIATGYGLDHREVGVRVPVRSRTFTSPCHPDRLYMYDIETVGVNAVKNVETVGENVVSVYRGKTSQILRASFRFLVTILAYSSALKTELVDSTESSANLCWTTRITFMTINLYSNLCETLK